MDAAFTGLTLPGNLVLFTEELDLSWQRLADWLGPGTRAGQALANSIHRNSGNATALPPPHANQNKGPKYEPTDAELTAAYGILSLDSKLYARLRRFFG